MNEKLRQQLTRLARKQPEVFGADSHEFEVNEPLSERTVAKFERKHGIVLPAEYRWFITKIGNGGAGPYYGVFPLGVMDDDHDYKEWSDSFVGRLSAPFPYTEAWNDLAGKPSHAFRDEDPWEYEKQHDGFDARYYKVLDGAFPICHRGCALRVWLVVSGPESGNLWKDDRADYKGLAPLTMPGSPRVSFLRWYQGWIDASLEGENFR